MELWSLLLWEKLVIWVNFFGKKKTNVRLDGLEKFCWDLIEWRNWNWFWFWLGLITNCYLLCADELISTSPKSRISEETNYTDVSAMKTPEVEAFSTPNYNNYCYEHPNSSSSSSKHQFHAEFLADKQTILSLSRKLPLSSGDPLFSFSLSLNFIFRFDRKKDMGIEH